MDEPYPPTREKKIFTFSIFFYFLAFKITLSKITQFLFLVGYRGKFPDYIS